MFSAILNATNSYFQKGMTFCRCIYVKKVMKLLAFIFKQPSYCRMNISDKRTQICLDIWTLIERLIERCVNCDSSPFSHSTSHIKT